MDNGGKEVLIFEQRGGKPVFVKSNDAQYWLNKGFVAEIEQIQNVDKPMVARELKRLKTHCEQEQYLNPESGWFKRFVKPYHDLSERFQEAAKRFLKEAAENGYS